MSVWTKDRLLLQRYKSGSMKNSEITQLSFSECESGETYSECELSKIFFGCVKVKTLKTFIPVYISIIYGNFTFNMFNNLLLELIESLSGLQH